MTTVETSRPASAATTSPMTPSPGGDQTTETRPRANVVTTPNGGSPGGAYNTRPTIEDSTPKNQALGGEDTRQAKPVSTPKADTPVGTDSCPANRSPVPKPDASGGDQLAGRHHGLVTHSEHAASDQPADRHRTADAQTTAAVGSQLDGQGTRGAQSGTAVDQPGPVASVRAPGSAASVAAPPMRVSLLDPALAFAADVLDDIERVRIANENRLRQLTRSVEDSDGEVRGFGLDESHPDVARLAAIVGTLAEVEKDATRHLEKVMRRHPLHAWAKGMKGVGDKQVARLLAVIGDPYIRPEIVHDDGTVIPAGPRTVSALWAYCGLHTTPVSGQPRCDTHEGLAANGANIPASQPRTDAHMTSAGRDQLAGRHPGHRDVDTQRSAAWVAARRQRGTKANWSTKAKSRAYLIAESCGKQLRKPCTAGDHVEDCGCSRYRLLYEQRKAATEGRTHAVACVRCGPAGKPAQPGTPWSDGHRHADALRIVAKRILRDLWREAKRLHEGGELS